MGDAPDIHALSERLAVQEERMKTMQAEYDGALDRLRADMAAHRADMAAHREDAAKHREDAAKRDKDNLRWLIGLWIAAVVILGVLIRL
ncbi:MAG: hypothetical protein OXE82_02880 [Rhodobacter sp.]|nr:hypothetical protein [Rhodobacter sp.]